MTLDDQWRRLIDAAQTASRAAYCPYSKFPVGAAVLAETGEVFSGCNVENASYGLSICAERNAIFRAAANGRRSIQRLAVFTPTPIPATPCGACRQVIREFSDKAKVLCVCQSNASLLKSIADLLPESFGSDNLRQN